MNPLLYFPACREPDLDVPRFCEKCATERPRRELEQCPDCLMEFCPGCWWDPEYEFCKDCLLKRYDRLEKMAGLLRRGEIEKAKELARTV